MDTKQETVVIIMDYIKALRDQIPNPEQVCLLHEMVEFYRILMTI